MSTEFDDKKIVPQPWDLDTRYHTSFERVIARLPSLEGKAGKFLKVDSDEESCSWSAGGSGGTTDYEDLENKPQINGVELVGNKSFTDIGIQAELDKKVSKVPGTTEFQIAVDTVTGQLYFEV